MGQIYKVDGITNNKFLDLSDLLIMSKKVK
jgi:hypothetical protein